MKTTKRILSLLLAVALVLSAAPMGLFTPASAADVATKSELTAALTADATVTLTEDIDYAAALTIPSGATLDLNGHNLYVNGLTNNGNTIVKNGGKLWANVATIGNLGSTASSASAVTNFWRAYEELLQDGVRTNSTRVTEFDGIRLTADCVQSTYAVTHANSTKAVPIMAANIPYITADSKDYYLLQLPDDKTVDLNGYELTLYCAGESIGDVQIIDSSVGETGTLGLRFSGLTNATLAGSMERAIAVARDRSDVQFTFFAATSTTLTFTDATPVPANAVLTKSASAKLAGTITFEVADETGFNRQGTGDLTTSGGADTAARAYKLVDNITLSAPVDLNGADIDYDWHTVTGTITNPGTESNKPAGAATVASKSELDSAISNGNNPITLSADINYDDVLTIPEGTTIDLAGNNLYVTGLVNNGTLTKNGGKLWANASTGDTLEAEPSAADVSNIWAANEELLRTGTEFDGIRLTASITSYSNAVTSGAEANKASILPRMAAEGAFVSGLYRAMPRIPEGKTLDLNGKTLVALAANTSFGTDTMGTGTIAANGGQIKLRIHNQSGWKFAVQTANAHPGIVSEIRHNNGSGSISTLGTSDPAYPVPAGVAVATAGCKLTAVVFEVASEADFTRTGTSSANITVVGFKLVDNITLSEDIDVGTKDVDYDNHTVTGGSIITTGTESNKPVVASPDVGTKAELDLALDAGLTAITLTTDIDYDDALTIPTGVTIDLNGKNLYVTGLIKEGTGALDKSDEDSKLWAKVTNADSLTAAPTAADVSNLWAADEELLRAGTAFDGIILGSNVSATPNPYNTGTNDEINEWRKANLPNMAAAGAFVDVTGSSKYGIIKIPSHKTLDLNGKTLTLRATQPTLGDGDIVDNGGSIVLWYSGNSSSNGNQIFPNAAAIANERQGIVSRFNQTGGDINYTSYPIPSGTSLTVGSGTTVGTITFLVANEADFTRTGYALANKFKLLNDITLDAPADLNGADIDYDWHTVTGTITNFGEESNKRVAAASVANETELAAALAGHAPTITLTADIDYNDVLTIPEGTTLDQDGNKLCVTGLVVNGVFNKNGGTLWANVSTNTAITAAVSAADVSNVWAAHEELLRAGTEFDGIRLTTTISSARTTGTTENVLAYLPNLAAAQTYGVESGNCFFAPYIPEGKFFDLNGCSINYYASAATIGTGTIMDSVGGGRIRFYLHPDYLERGTYANALAIAATRSTQDVFQLIQTGTYDYATLDPLPVNMVFSTYNATVNNLKFAVKEQADFTRTGYANAAKFVLVGDLTLDGNVNVGAADVDYQNHTVTGGKIITTGDEFNKVVTPNVSTKAELDDAIKFGQTAITLLADIDYDDVLTIPTGVTVELGNFNLYVTGLVKEGTGDIAKSGTGKLWANVSASAALTETPTAADVSNIWAANEELLDENTEFDGIRLTANLSYGAAATAASKATILPNLYAADAFVNNNSLGHAVVKIPAGKILDLNGHTFNMPAAQSTLGEGTIETNGGKITAYFYGIDNSVPNFANAVALANAYPNIVTRLWHNANELVFTDAYVIPSGTTFAKNSSAMIKGTLVFGVANEADFTRDGVDVAVEEGAVKQFKLLNGITLTQDIDVGAANVDYDWHTVAGYEITTTGDELHKVTPNVGDKTTLDKALEAGLATITLTADIDYNAVLTIPTGVTVELGNFNLYVTGLVKEGTGDIAKSGTGKLWARVNTTAALSAAPTAESGLNNLWAANEELLRSGTDFDGIWLAGSISTGSNNPYGTGTNEEVVSWLETNLPNLWAADALSMKFNDGENYVKYGIISIPDGKTLDLNGKTLTLRATRPTLGEGEIVANGGSITLWYNGTTSSVGGQTLKNADDIAAERSGIVKAYNQTGSAVQYNNYPIPSGVTLTLAGASTVTEGHTVTFLVANEADFTRTGTDSEKITAKTFKLTDSFTLTEDVTLTGATFDFNGCYLYVTDETVTADELATNGGGYAKIVTTEGELTAAVGGSNIGKIVIGADITLTANLNAQNTAIEVAAGFTFSTGGFTLTKTSVTSGAPEYGTFVGEVSASETTAATVEELNTALAGDSDVIKLTADIDYDAVLTIPTGKTVDLNGNNLYVTGVVNNGFGFARTDGGKLWANVSAFGVAPADISIESVSNIWAAFEVLMTPDTALDGVRMAAAMNGANSTATTGNLSRVPNMVATGAYKANASGSNYFLPQIPAGKTFDLNGNNVSLYAVTASMGAGDVINSGEGGKIRLFYNDADGRGDYENAVAIANAKPTIGFNFVQYSTMDYAGLPAIPANATLSSSTGSAITQADVDNLAMAVTSAADFTRTGAATATQFRVVSDLVLTDDVTLSDKDVFIENDKTLDLAGHTLDLGEGAFTTNFGFITDASTNDKDNDTFGLVKAGSFAMSNSGRNLDITGLDEKTDAAVRNAYQPLYDSAAGGYRFFQIAENIRTAAKMSDDNRLTFRFIFNFSNAAAWDLVIKGDSEMAFWFSLKNAETLDSEADGVEYYLNAETMAEYAEKQKTKVGANDQYQLTASIRAPFYSDVAHYDYRDRYVWTDPYLGSMQTAAFAYQNHGNTKFSPKWFSVSGEGVGVVSATKP